MRLIPCLVLFASVAGCTGGGSPPGPPPATGSRQPQEEANGVVGVGEFSDLYNTYVSNPSAANTRYAGKVLEGILRADAVDAGEGKARITQHTALTGDTVETLKVDPTKGVTAEFDGPGPASAKKGDRLKIRCEVRAYEAGVLTLHRCQVVETLPAAEPKKDGQPAGRFPGSGDSTFKKQD